MTVYADAIERRFGDGGPSGDAQPTMSSSAVFCRARRCAATATSLPDEGLLDLLVAAALSASAKSDFQQASILRVSRPGQAGGDRRAVSGDALDRRFAGVLRLPRRCAAAAAHRRDARQAGAQRHAGRLLQRQRRCRPRAADHDPLRRVGRARRLPDQRASATRSTRSPAILGLPDLVFPVAGLCLGYPQGGGFVSLRLPRGVTTHRDALRRQRPRLKRSTTTTAAATHATAFPKDQHRSNAEFGEADFYGWSEDKARQAAKAEGAAFPPYLRAHGFTLD